MNSGSGEQGSARGKGSPVLYLPAETLRRSNLALRHRCEEMEGWQRRTREDREFLSCRFQEARALVERLAEENHSLRSLVNGPVSSSSSSQTEDLQSPPVRRGPADGAQVSRANVPPVDSVSANVSSAPVSSLWTRGMGRGQRKQISAHRPRPPAVW